MKTSKLLIKFFIFALFITSCEKDDEELTNYLNKTEEKISPSVLADLEVEDFVYKGLNDIYLYKNNIPELADNYFSNNAEKEDYLADFSSPEKLFDELKYSQDRFSFITDDYVSLEESFKGISSGTAGMNFGVGRISETNNVFAYLQYVEPGTSAANAGLKRGTVFTEVNGTKMTINNFQDLFNANIFTINVGYVEDGGLKFTGETVTLNHSQYTENPIHIIKTFVIDERKVGYLMYNSFVADFDTQLNAAFGYFKAEGISDLVLDLRYNGGGSVESAVDLAGMITGQFEGEIFMKEQWNDKYQEYFESNNPEDVINRFDSSIRTEEPINSLRLSRVYVLTSQRTASASELVINGLEPYVDVIQVGTTTTGKFQASLTLYDSPDFGREGANKNHKYAIQPLVFKSANAVGKSDYVSGLVPDVVYSEDLGNLGVLGELTEPLLNVAINHMTGKSQETKSQQMMKVGERIELIGNSNINDLNYQRMYIEKVPPVLKD